MARGVAAAAAMRGHATSPQEQHSRLSLLLGLLSTVGAFTIDAFFPSLRAIAGEFGLSTWQVQQSVTAYMLPYAIVSLLHGSLSDAMGRRRLILVSLAIYTAASVGCALAPNFLTLLLFRCLQGLVGGAGFIIGRAIVRDRYQGAEAQRLMSMITMIFGLGPAVAPIVGGWVHVLLGWRAVFGTMALLGASLLIFAARRLPETHPPENRTALHVGELARRNLAVLRNREFLWLAMGSGLCFISLQVYVGAAPAIVLDHWGLNETQFAALNLPIIGGYTLGAAMSGRLAGRFAPDRQARLGFRWLLALTGAMLALQLALSEPPIYLQQVLLAGIAVGLQLMYPVVTLRVLDLFPASRGAASSMQSFLSLIMGSVTMGMLAPVLAQSMRRLAWASILTTATGALLWRLAQRYRAAHRQAA